MWDCESSYSRTFVKTDGKNNEPEDEGRYTISSKSSINNTQQNVYKVKGEPKSSTGNRWTPDIEAKDFVPIDTYSTSSEKCTIFGSFGLENLLNYDVEVLPEKELFDYSFALRDRVMQNIHEFGYTDELEILCQLTDGTQTQKNQKIITTRMCVIVGKALERLQTPTSSAKVNVCEVKSEPLQNKNLCAYESSFSNYSAMNVDAIARKNINFSMKESCTVSPKSSINNTQQNVYKVKDEPKSSTGNRWTPDIEAKDFVPIDTHCTTYEKGTIFGSFGLENLLNYNVEIMPEKELFDYSYALRNKIMQKICEFRYTDELEMLCLLTDGTQTKRNQKIITFRMCVIVDKALKKQQTSANIRIQNHDSKRIHQGRNRGSYHRY